jgi:hypothetical protein
MIKSIIKIVIAVLLANALWRIASAYISYYKFQDAVQEYSIRSGGKSDDEIKNRVAELASQYEEPVDADSVQVTKNEQHTYIEASYTKPVAVLPGYEYQWPFSMKADGFLIEPRR